MLKITRKVEYALIALKHMQSKEGESLSTAKEIAYQYNVPQQLLAKSLQQMSKNNIIEATKGINGGYRIKANLSGISLKDFFEKLEGPLGVMDCYFDSECQISGCNVKAPIEKINYNIRKMLSTMTLKEVTQ